MEEHYIEITRTGENGECDECKSNQQPIGQEEGDTSPVRYGIPGQAGDDGWIGAGDDGGVRDGDDVK